MRPSTLTELAAHYGVPVPPIRGFGSFTAFADQYEAATHVLRTESDLRRLTREVVEDAAAAGAVWIEPQLYPARYVDTLGGVGEASDIEIDEGRAVGARLGVGFGLMITADRTGEVAESEELARLAATRSESGVVSFGLANDEVGHPPELFEKAFRIATEAGLISAPHAGELVGPESIRGALDTLHASRIAHGVRAVEDPELVARLVAEEICLDVCPTSNLLLSVVPSLAVHPLKQLVEAGVRCTLNGDDPLLFGPGLLEEYVLARDVLGLSDEQLAFIARCSIEDSGAPEELVADAVARIDQWAL
ncbi:MAG: adenosine deaminase [Frankiales bacterium]|nr:adenosine deaminase [Frankiales bacterium]